MTVPIWRIFGQSIPLAAIATNLYTVAEGRQACLETLTICNQGPAATTVRVSVLLGGVVPIDTRQYLYYDLALQPADTFVHRGPMRLFTHDELWVESASGLVSFNAFGQEEFV